MPVSAVPADHLTHVLRHVVVGLVQRDGPDLSARQLAVFLICYLEEGPHTVRGLAAQLGISKPAITRSLDRLGALGLARRAEDPRDRRSVVVQRTRTGLDLLAELRTLLRAGGEQVRASAPAPRRGAQPHTPLPKD